MEPTFLGGDAVSGKRPILDDAPRLAHERPAKVSKSEPPVLRVAGVPEHFNIPWHLAIESKSFENAGVKIDWITEGKGTGAMIKHLKDNTADVVIALTEGLVRDIVTTGSDIRLLGTYVGSPLCWALSTAGKASKKHGAIKSVEDLETAKWAVSRMGSGSHLMASVLASQRGWSTADQKFNIIGGFQALRDSVNDGTSDVFMWETFTTKPWHDSGEVTRLGDISTPWPCFMLAARKETVDTHLESLQRMLAVVNGAAKDFHAAPEAAINEVVKRQGQKREDAAAWFSTVNISAERFISEAALDRVVDALKCTGDIARENQIDLNDLIDGRLAELHRDIKSMKLYNKPELVTAMHKRLAAKGLSKGAVAYSQLNEFDLNLYHGTTALDRAIKDMPIHSTSRIINVGSNMGGPARYVAGKVGCQVLACELQGDLHSTAEEFTQRAGLSNMVHHIHGNFMSISAHLQLSAYDGIMSWLTMLHFEDRPMLFRRCYELLRPGGVFYAGDFFEAGKFTAAELRTLRDDVSCPSLYSSAAAYKSDLEKAGFTVTLVEDVTSSWKEFTRARYVAFKAERDQQVAVLGEPVYQGLLSFYKLINDLYQGGNLGGIRIMAKKPLGW